MLRIEMTVAQILPVEGQTLRNEVGVHPKQVAQVRQAVDARGEKRPSPFQDSSRFLHAAMAFCERT